MPYRARGGRACHRPGAARVKDQLPRGKRRGGRARGGLPRRLQACGRAAPARRGRRARGEPGGRELCLSRRHGLRGPLGHAGLPRRGRGHRGPERRRQDHAHQAVERPPASRVGHRADGWPRHARGSHQRDCRALRHALPEPGLPAVQGHRARGGRLWPDASGRGREGRPRTCERGDRALWPTRRRGALLALPRPAADGGAGIRCGHGARGGASRRAHERP